MASREVIALEAQLRRYADQVEGSVGEVAPDSAPARRRWPFLAVAAALVLVAAVGLAFVVANDDDGGNVDVDPAREGDLGPLPDPTDRSDDFAERDDDVSAGTSSPPWLGEGGELITGVAFPIAPLSLRFNTLTLRSTNHVVVWGGEREDRGIDEVYGDGAVLDLRNGTWRSMSPSPIPTVDYRPTAVDLGGRLLVVRRQHAAFYSIAEDQWVALPSINDRIEELHHAPEIDAVIARGAERLHVLDLATETWSDIGAAGDATEWTGDQLVRVSVVLGSPAQAGTWSPDVGWSDDIVELPVVQVIDTGWVGDEVWIVDYGMRVRSWNPSTGEQRSLPPIPLEFIEGTPRVFVHSTFGDVAVVRSPGLALWTGAGWIVQPIPETLGSDAQLDPTGRDRGQWWSYVYDGEGSVNRLVAETMPRASEVREVLVGGLVVTLSAGEFVTETGIDERNDGVHSNPWAVISSDEGSCRFQYTGGLVAGAVHLRVAGSAMTAECEEGIDLNDFVDRVRGVWDGADPNVIADIVLTGDMPGFEDAVEDGGTGVDGVVATPVVVGLFADTAAATLRSSGLEPVTEFVTVPFGDPQVGVVISQSPAGFTEVEPGMQVVITVGEAGPDPDQ